MLIDIGGTPASILKSDKYPIALANGIPKKAIVAILDPFDLSRSERTFYWNNEKIKIKIKSNDVNIDSESEIILEKSDNLRNLMNSYVKLKYPDLRLINLEFILSKNKAIIYDIQRVTKFPVRAVCPVCNRFKRIILGNNEMCCNVLDKEIIDNGKYIPQQGYLSVILYLCGYKTFSNDIEKKKQIKEIKKILNFKGDPLCGYIMQDCTSIKYKNGGNLR